ncbi:MAG: polysaccharide deacetylase family protein [Anaerolineae bacterium]|nr:polysaccharide deacetylase family protein [Anaerolineae bacterium]
MIEIVIPLLAAVALGGLGLRGWHLFRGPARSRVYLILRLVVVGLVTMLLVTVSVWRFSKSRRTQLFGGMVTRVETSEPVVALTFDDGPEAGDTEEILAILEAKGVQATFFVIGRALAENPAEGPRIVAAGHELGNHTYSHRQMLGVKYSTVKEEIEQTDALIRAAGYKGAIHFRPPYGKRFIVLPYYLHTHRRKTIYWNIEPESYSDIVGNSDLITAHVLENLTPGAIILLHAMGESRAATRQAVPGIIEGALAQGYQFVTVSELLEYTKTQ